MIGNRKSNFACAVAVASTFATGLFGASAWAQQVPADVNGTTAPAPAATTQDASETSTGNAATDDAANVVVITANKRRQTSQDIAGTITSFSGEALEANGVKDAEDMLQRAPGVQVNKGDPDLSLPTIRGVGTVTNSNIAGLQQSTTGIYIEDVPFTDPISVTSTPDLAPFDLQGVDILRGPQGALYGSSSLGGAIRYTLNKPDLKNVDAAILVDAGAPVTGGVNHSEYAMLNIPLQTDVAAFRAVVFDRREAGYIDNLGTGINDANTLHQQGGRLMGLLKPDPTLKISATYLYQDTYIADGFAVSPNPDSMTINTPTASSRDGRFSLGQLLIEKDYAGLTWTSSTSEVNKRVHAQYDGTASWSDIGVSMGFPLLPVVDGPMDTDSHAFSQEFRVAGTAGKLNFVTGLFYQNDKGTYDAKYNAPGGAALFGPTLIPNDVLYTEDDINNTTERAIFADTDYQLNKEISIGLGGRYYTNTQESSYNSHLLDALWGVVPTLLVDNTQSGFTPKADVKYKFSDAEWYALVSEGYRFGGVNPGTTPSSRTQYTSDKLWNYETGVRFYPSKDFSLNLATYFVDWKDAQVSALVGTGQNAVNGIANVGKAKITGDEVTLVWTPVKSFTLQESLAYINAVTAVDFDSPSGAVIASGTRLPGTARFQSSEEADYRFNGFADSTGRIALTHSYVGERTTNLDLPGTLGSYQLFDLRMSLAWTNYEFTAYANNIANSRGLSGGSKVLTLGGNMYDVYYPTKPRVIGVSLRYDF